MGNDCASVVKSYWISECYAALTLRIRIHCLTQYCLRRLCFLLIRILAATIAIYCKQTAVTNVTSKSALLEMIDRSSEYHQITNILFYTALKLSGVSEILSAGKSADLLSKQCNLVTVNGRRRCTAGKITIGLSLYWPWPMVQQSVWYVCVPGQ